jgi:hypothetical protein
MELMQDPGEGASRPWAKAASVLADRERDMAAFAPAPLEWEVAVACVRLADVLVEAGRAVPFSGGEDWLTLHLVTQGRALATAADQRAVLAIGAGEALLSCGGGVERLVAARWTRLAIIGLKADRLQKDDLARLCEGPLLLDKAREPFDQLARLAQNARAIKAVLGAAAHHPFEEALELTVSRLIGEALRAERAADPVKTTC